MNDKNESQKAPCGVFIKSGLMPNVFCYITEDGTLFVGTFEGYSVIYSKRFKEPQLKEVYSEKKSFYEGI